MKNLSFIGVLLLLISLLLFYFTTNFEVEQIKLSHFMGIVGGIGIGLIIGGIVGYVSKGSAVKAKKGRQNLRNFKLKKKNSKSRLQNWRSNI